MGTPQLLVFDSRRGNREGEEADKILAFHPAEAPVLEQITTAGLLHGLLLFSSNFSQDLWEVAETDKSVWVAHQAEPHIWFALAAPRAWVPRHCTQGNLRAVLAQAHQIVSLLHGPIEGLLQQDASGQHARCALLPTLEHLGRQLANPLSWQHRQLRNPLTDTALAPLMRLPPPAALVLQSFCAAVQLVALRGAGGGGVEGVVVLHQAHVLWSSLAPADGAAVYSLAATALLHPQSAMQRGGTAEASAPCILDSGCWHQLPSKFVVLRPGCWRGCQQPAMPAEGEEEVACVPEVLIQSGQEPCQLLPYKEGKLWVLLLVSASVALNQHALGALQAAVAGPAQHLAVLVAQELRNAQTEPGHVPGYRYMYCDRESGTVCETPRIKISAMLHHSRALAASMRESLPRLQPPKAGGATERDARQGVGWEEGGWGGQQPGGSTRSVAKAGGGGQWEQWHVNGALPQEQPPLAEETWPDAELLPVVQHEQRLQSKRGGANSPGNAACEIQEAPPADFEQDLQQVEVDCRLPVSSGPEQQQQEEGPSTAAGGDSSTGMEEKQGGIAAGRDGQQRLDSAVQPSLSGPATREQLAGYADTPPAVGANDVLELFVKSSQECWGAARSRPRVGRQVLVVRERKAERSVAEGAAVMDAFLDSFPC